MLLASRRTIPKQSLTYALCEYRMRFNNVLREKAVVSKHAKFIGKHSVKKIAKQKFVGKAKLKQKKQ